MRNYLTFFLLLLLARVCRAQSVTTTQPVRDQTWYVETYGAKAGDATDDRAAIQRALDSAETAGGGVVKLGRGTYIVTTVNSPASGDKAAGAYGLEMPSNVTLEGVGPATVISIVSGGAFGVGCGISPKGMRTATTNFGAASNVGLRDFKIQAAAQADSSGNLLNLVHASDWLVERVTMGDCLYHGLEVDQSRRLTFRDCVWNGSMTGISGSWVQFDYGLAGPVNRPAGITTRLVQDVLFDTCRFIKRPDTDTSARDIDMVHATDLILDNIEFRDCVMEGRAAEFVALVGFDNSGARVQNVRFDGCKFVTNHAKSYAVLLSNTSTIVNRLAFANCEFAGTSALALVLGGSTSITYNATHDLRQSVSVTGCAFRFDKTGMPTLFDIGLVSLTAWTHAEFSGNFVRGVGDFPVSVGSSSCYLLRAINNLSTVWKDNQVIWEGNNTFGVTRSLMYLSTVEADNAGTTRGMTIADNRMHSTAATGWSYGLINLNGSTVPSTRAYICTGNAGNVANTADNNSIITGTTSAGPQSSGSLSLAVRAVTGSTTATRQDGVILANTTSGNITITLPNVQFRHAFYVVKTAAANTVTVGTVTLSAVNSAAIVFSDGTTNTAVQIQ